MKKRDLERDWLAGNAIVAFAGSTILALTWKGTEVDYQLPFGWIIPGVPSLFSLGVVAFLLILSFTLALASLVPTMWFPKWIVPAAAKVSIFLTFLVWLAYILSLIEWLNALPTALWWSEVIGISAIAMFVFLTFRLGYEIFSAPARWKRKRE